MLHWDENRWMEFSVGTTDAKASEKPWVKRMGKLKHLRMETAHINRRIAEDCEKIDPRM
jgi:hypothetical protein